MSQRLLQLFVASAGILFITGANAADYAAGVAIDAQASHNDNIRLTQNDEISSGKYNVSPTVTFQVNTETTKTRLDSTFDFNRYDESEFDSNDQSVALTLSRQFESGSIGLDADFTRNSTTTSELLTTGRIGTKAERAEQYTVSPNASYTLSERNLIQLSGTYTTQSYEGDGYIGYDNVGADLNWLYLIDERLKLIAAASYSDYQSDDLSIATLFLFAEQSYSTRTKTKDLQIGAVYQITEQSLLNFRLGRSRNDTTYAVKDPSNLCESFGQLAQLFGAICSDIPHAIGYGSTAYLSWNWKGELQQFDLNATKTTQPTSNGYTVDSIRVTSNWSYKLSELDKFIASASLARNQALNDDNSLQNTSQAERDYGSATLRYQRQLNEYWFASASVQFSKQKYTQTDYEAGSTVYSVGISYKPQEWHWSR